MNKEKAMPINSDELHLFGDSQVYQQGSNTIHFYDEINRKTVFELKRIISSMIKDRFVNEVNIVINSMGGMGLGFYDYLKACPLPINTYIEGYCCSAATLLFLAGKERYISPTSLFMIHSFSGGAPEVLNEGQSQDFLDSMKKHNSSIIEHVYKKTTKLPKDMIKQIPYKEIWLTPEECVEYKIANDIQTFFNIE
jgi:ATP-dependent Clp protease protease subunit